jgi:glycosyltransferase involved in cell wall biosynthesis
MKISLFTPTHDLTYFKELAESVIMQDHDEWVIVPNNGVSASDVQNIVGDDPRVVIIPLDITKNVGALKRFACDHCTGDILVEVDHDDILVKDAIAKIRQVYLDDPNVGFVYSECAEFVNDEKRTPWTYSEYWGWSYKDFDYGDFKYRSANAPGPVPEHMSRIHYAPNHIRSWKKDAYDKAGKHNPDLKVADDADLICRLYCETKFVCIRECLYLQRMHTDSTWSQNKADIQTHTYRLQREYLHKMIEAEAKRRDEVMIDLGGRFGNPNGYLSVDRKGANINTDLNEKWPFEDSSIYCVRAFDLLEHLPDTVHAMSEIHRVLKPGGYLISLTPSTHGPGNVPGRGAYMDPTHVRFFNKASFWYWTRQQQAKYIDNDSIRFKTIILEELWPSKWHEDNLIPYVRFDAVCLKDGYREHGEVLI